MANTTDKKDKKAVISHGIEALIERLRAQGVLAGKNEADNILKEAKDEADKIIHQAQSESKALLSEAHAEIQKEKTAVENALQLAARNMRLELRQHFINRFKDEVKRLIGKELANEATLRQLILLLTVDTREELQSFKNKHIEIQLPNNVLDFDQIRKNPKLLDNDPLKLLAQGITSQMLKNGVELKVRMEGNNFVGMKIRIIDDDVEMDLTDEAITDLLLKHIQPRFRALLEGLLR